MKILVIMMALWLHAGSLQSQPVVKMNIKDVERYIAAAKDSVLVINFWATFCKPCVAEIPSFIKITEDYKNKGVKLLLISLDLPDYYPAKITAFAKKHTFNTNIALLHETNADYFCPKVDAKWSCSIPATLMINTKTGVRTFYEEDMTAIEFESRLKEVTGN